MKNQKFDNQITLMPKFIYNKTLLEKPADNNSMVNQFWMFNYFILNEEMAQTYFVPISTCRYPNQIAKIRVFPDIEWEFSLNVEATQPARYSYTNMPEGEINRFHNDRALEAARARRTPDSLPVSVELKLKSTVNTTESKELSAGFEAKIKSVVRMLVKIKDLIDQLTRVDEVRASSVSSATGIRKPFTFKVDYPIISIIGSWKYGFDKDHNNKVVKTGSISFAFNPLIKGEGVIDLLACLEIYPAARAVIRAADLILSSLNGELIFEIYAYGALNLEGSLHFNKPEVADFKSSTVVGLGVRLGGKIDVKQINSITFRGDREEEVSLIAGEISGKGETSLKLKLSRGLDDKGIFTEIALDFEGVAVTVTMKAQYYKFLKGGFENKKFTLVDPIPDLYKSKEYIIY